MKYVVQRLVRRTGYEIRRRYPPDFSPELIGTIERVLPYTLTSVENIAASCAAAEYVARHDIPGDVVECGVWRGGSMMAIALTLLEYSAGTRHLHLFDTFAGMTAPSDVDVRLDGVPARRLFERAWRDDPNRVWRGVPRDEVERAMLSTTYDPALVHYVEGRVEDTLPAAGPELISLLRLDTDWHGSTKHELTHLFPRLAVGGLLIVDDYGHFAGARRAVDEYLAEKEIQMLLARVDYTARIAVKQAPRER